jgi:hypothetical protein
MEVLVKPNKVAPVRIVLELFGSTKHLVPSIFHVLEDALTGVAIGKMEGLKRPLYMGGFS